MADSATEQCPIKTFKTPNRGWFRCTQPAGHDGAHTFWQHPGEGESPGNYWRRQGYGDPQERRRR